MRNRAAPLHLGGNVDYENSPIHKATVDTTAMQCGGGAQGACIYGQMPWPNCSCKNPPKKEINAHTNIDSENLPIQHCGAMQGACIHGQKPWPSCGCESPPS